MRGPWTSCEFWCGGGPVGLDGFPGDDELRAMCPACRATQRWLTRNVIPAIRRHGYYAPPGTTAEQELAAMAEQWGFAPTLDRLLRDLGVEPPDAADGDQ